MEVNKELVIDTGLMQIITPEQAWHYHILPLSASEKRFVFYYRDSDLPGPLKEELEILFGREIVLEKLPGEELEKAIGRHYRRGEAGSNRRTRSAGDAGSEDFIIDLINEAHATGASDIHLEPFEHQCLVRLRIDGKLIERYKVHRSQYPSLVNKIKIKANLDIAEKRLPQDGRIFHNAGGQQFDIRVSVLPTLHGEKVVLRLLGRQTANLHIQQLGFDTDQMKTYLEGIRKTRGIVLISGPTGSGKTTTLYATLKVLNKPDTNILTIEDPIEYTLEGINQVQLKEGIGLTFAAALRTFLRQDPDIIMLGEIRDGETAQMAVRAALTGHLVLSTIHTNSAWGTVSRLVDMGVPPFLVAGTLNLTLAQRLVRLLCPVCKVKTPFAKEMLPHTYTPAGTPGHVYLPGGCEECYYTGYKGRKAVYEVIAIDPYLEKKIKSGDTALDGYMQERNISAMSQRAWELVCSGDTSPEEVYGILLNTSST
ncbi:MAG: type II/IV secretion system protein [Bacteroidales bacterium]|nr:type II/IV secretion system protein [Bacteroidales bacterium]